MIFFQIFQRSKYRFSRCHSFLTEMDQNHKIYSKRPKLCTTTPFLKQNWILTKFQGGLKKNLIFFHRIFTDWSTNLCECLMKWTQIHVNGLFQVSFALLTPFVTNIFITNGVLGVTKKYDIFSDFSTIEIQVQPMSQFSDRNGSKSQNILSKA